MDKFLSFERLFEHGKVNKISLCSTLLTDFSYPDNKLLEFLKVNSCIRYSYTTYKFLFKNKFAPRFE